MSIIKNVIEYYDELYPVTNEQKSFYNSLISSYTKPVKFLKIGCGTGYMEHLLARDGHDVTGLDTSIELLEAANLKRRNQLMAIRFFQMSTLDMTRFLGKSFYNIISCLNNQIIFIHDKTLIKKFFFDCKQLLAPGGTIVLQLSNFYLYSNEPEFELPDIETLRTNLYTQIETSDNGEQYLFQQIETGNGKILPVMENEKVYTITLDEIKQDALEAGFVSTEAFADYNKSPFTKESPNLVVVIK